MLVVAGTRWFSLVLACSCWKWLVLAGSRWYALVAVGSDFDVECIGVDVQVDCVSQAAATTARVAVADIDAHEESVNATDRGVVVDGDSDEEFIAGCATRAVLLRYRKAIHAAAALRKARVCARRFNRCKCSECMHIKAVKAVAIRVQHEPC